MKIVLISGVTGMTGSELARQLMARGCRVVGFDNFFASSLASVQDLLASDRFHFFPYDLNSPADLAALEGALAEWRRPGDELAFVNCAAVVHTKFFYQPSATFSTNVLGMRAFLDQAVRLRAGTFINCSTSEVYSLQSFAAGGVRESDPLALAGVEESQRASYAVGKLQTEFFLKEACDEGRIRGCSLRFANVYSEGEMLGEHIIPYTIRALERGPRITLLENARDTRRTFLHNCDSAAAVVLLLEAPAALDGSAYNVGTDEEIGMVPLVEQIAARMGVPDLEITFAGTRTADPRRRLLNIDKLRQRTGWIPAIDLATGIGRCVEHRRAAAFAG
jgi:nucleoside-diphosphate-sugar epimerase